MQQFGLKRSERMSSFKILKTSCGQSLALSFRPSRFIEQKWRPRSKPQASSPCARARLRRRRLLDQRRGHLGALERDGEAAPGLQMIAPGNYAGRGLEDDDEEPQVLYVGRLEDGQMSGHGTWRPGATAANWLRGCRCCRTLLRQHGCRRSIES